MSDYSIENSGVGERTTSRPRRPVSDAVAGTDDQPPQDPYPCRVPPSAEALAALLVQLGAASDLEPARSPGIHPLEIVDDEGDARVGPQIAPLLRASEPMPADLDRLILGA